MVLLLLEALLAGLLLVFIVWWTMFSGRPKGELPNQGAPDGPTEASDRSEPACATENAATPAVSQAEGHRAGPGTAATAPGADQGSQRQA